MSMWNEFPDDYYEMVGRHEHFEDDQEDRYLNLPAGMKPDRPKVEYPEALMRLLNKDYIHPFAQSCREFFDRTGFLSEKQVKALNGIWDRMVQRRNDYIQRTSRGGFGAIGYPDIGYGYREDSHW